MTTCKRCKQPIHRVPDLTVKDSHMTLTVPGGWSTTDGDRRQLCFADRTVTSSGMIKITYEAHEPIIEPGIH